MTGQEEKNRAAETAVEPEIVSVPRREGPEYSAPERAMIITAEAEEASRPGAETVEPEVVSSPPPFARSTAEKQAAPKSGNGFFRMARYIIGGAITAVAAFMFFWVFLAALAIGLLILVPIMLLRGPRNGFVVKRFYVKR